MSCGVGHRSVSDLMWLWLRPAAVAPIGPLSWELPYAVGVALKSKNKQTNKKKQIKKPGTKTILYICTWLYQNLMGTTEQNITVDRHIEKEAN